MKRLSDAEYSAAAARFNDDEEMNVLNELSSYLEDVATHLELRINTDGNVEVVTCAEDNLFIEFYTAKELKAFLNGLLHSLPDISTDKLKAIRNIAYGQ